MNLESPEQQRSEGSPSTSSGPSSSSMPPGMVRHVAILAYLLIAQGVLEAFMGIALLVATFAGIGLLQSAAEQEGIQWSQTASTAYLLYANLLTILLLVVSALQIVAGMLNFRFRGRVLGIIALITSSFASVLTCYCFPTAIALLVYGLITYLDPATKRAFAMGNSGRSKADILASFAYSR